MTINFGTTAKTLIENYHLASSTVGFFIDPDIYGRYITGPQLDRHAQTLINPINFYNTKSVEFTEVHVLEYTSSLIKAIGCGQLHIDLLNRDGSFIRTIRPIRFMNVYIFVWEDDIWKVYTSASFRDPQYDVHSLEYLNSEEKNAIGNLQSYIDRYFPC